MLLTPSTMMPLGTRAPDFTLPEPLSGADKSLQQLQGEAATVLVFICNHCPFVVHIEQALAQLGRDYAASPVAIIAISANDADSYPMDGPEAMAKKAEAAAYTFPYLYDESQAVAQAYGAACTPDFFVFDGNLACVYRGQFDDSRPGNQQRVTGADLRGAIESVLAGSPVREPQYPSIGCNIKWK